MKSKELIEFHKIEKNIMKKLNARKKIEKSKLDTYFKKLDEIVNTEITLNTKQKGG